MKRDPYNGAYSGENVAQRLLVSGNIRLVQIFSGFHGEGTSLKRQSGNPLSTKSISVLSKATSLEP